MFAITEPVSIVRILAITIPLVVGLVAFIWRWQERQDTKITETCTRTAQLETKIEGHKEELERGQNKFEGIAGDIGSIKESNAATVTKLEGVAQLQVRMDGKIDELLAKG